MAGDNIEDTRGFDNHEKPEKLDCCLYPNDDELLDPVEINCPEFQFSVSVNFNFFYFKLNLHYLLELIIYLDFGLLYLQRVLWTEL